MSQVYSDPRDRLEQILTEEVGPALQMDLSDLEVRDFSEGVLQLRLGSVCAG